MKKIFIQKVLFLIIGITCIGYSSAQSFEEISHTDNTSCASAKDVCGAFIQHYDFRTKAEDCIIEPLYYVFTFANASTIELQIPGGGTYDWYGLFNDYSLDACDQILNYTANTVSGTISGTSVLLNGQVGTYILKLVPTDCNGKVAFKPRRDGDLACGEQVLCDECVTSFSPKPGKYVVSAWVKEDNADAFTTTYQNSSIRLSFNGVASPTITIVPSGAIIDGWQRLEQEIEIPVGATGMNMELVASNVDAFFDDIRFFPFDGSMMSYVYDPESLRLMAELDERNYATLYEYDEEGKLIRVKKETEKGVMTIQENGDNIQK